MFVCVSPTLQLFLLPYLRVLETSSWSSSSLKTIHDWTYSTSSTKLHNKCKTKKNVSCQLATSLGLATNLTSSHQVAAPAQAQARAQARAQAAKMMWWLQMGPGGIALRGKAKAIAMKQMQQWRIMNIQKNTVGCHATYVEVNMASAFSPFPL